MSESDPTAAERQKRYRQRLKACSMIAITEIPYDLTCLLMDKGYLTEEGGYDARERGLALLRYLLTLMSAARVGNLSRYAVTPEIKLNP